MTPTELQVGTILAPRQIIPGEIELFLFSAAAWLPHRIHYDRAFALSDGHSGLIVPGPLQGSYLVQHVEDVLRPAGGGVTAFSYRHLAPAAVAHRYECRAELTRAEGQGEATL